VILAAACTDNLSGLRVVDRIPFVFALFLPAYAG
jgi:hypothetical protein